MEKELLLSVHDLKKSFGEREILKGISFDVRRGDVVCIIGPSGSGKSFHMNSSPIKLGQNKPKQTLNQIV